MRATANEVSDKVFLKARPKCSSSLFFRPRSGKYDQKDLLSLIAILRNIIIHCRQVIKTKWQLTSLGTPIFCICVLPPHLKYTSLSLPYTTSKICGKVLVQRKQGNCSDGSFRTSPAAPGFAWESRKRGCWLTGSKYQPQHIRWGLHRHCSKRTVGTCTWR